MRNVVLGILCALWSSGCVAFDAVSGAPVKGRAYFVRHVASVGEEMWVCDASSGRPLCYQAASAQNSEVTAN